MFLYVQIKEELLLMSDALSDDTFGLKTNFAEIIRELWPSFERVQLDHVTTLCKSALEESCFQPMDVTTVELFTTQIKAFQLDMVRLDTNSTSTSHSASKTNTVADSLDMLEEELEAKPQLSAASDGENNSGDESDDSSELREGSNMNRYNTYHIIYILYII